MQMSALADMIRQSALRLRYNEHKRLAEALCRRHSLHSQRLLLFTCIIEQLQGTRLLARSSGPGGRRGANWTIQVNVR